MNKPKILTSKPCPRCGRGMRPLGLNTHHCRNCDAIHPTKKKTVIYCPPNNAA